MSDVTLPAPLVAALSRALDDAYQAGRRDAINALVAAAGNGHAPFGAVRERKPYTGGAAWSAAEIALLREMYTSGHPPREIAAALQERFGTIRTSGAVTRMRIKLGLPVLPAFLTRSKALFRRHAERAS